MNTNRRLREEFSDCTKVLLVRFRDEDVAKFYDEWVRKIAHARLAEYIKCYSINQKYKRKKRVKGGQTLRDELYGAGKKCVRKAPRARLIHSPATHTALNGAATPNDVGIHTNSCNNSALALLNHIGLQGTGTVPTTPNNKKSSRSGRVCKPKKLRDFDYYLD